MVSSVNSNIYAPLESEPILYWNESTSSVTLSIEVLTNNNITLTNADAWIEVDEMGTSGFPLTLNQTNRVATVLSSTSNQPSSSATWTTTGLTNPIPQYLSVTFTPVRKGPLYLRVMLARASTTMYFDPVVTGTGSTPTSSSRQWMGVRGSVVNEGSSDSVSSAKFVAG
jgi:hypothetical protein